MLNTTLIHNTVQQQQTCYKLLNPPAFSRSLKFNGCLSVSLTAVDDDAVPWVTDFSFAIFQFLLLPTLVLDEQGLPQAAKKVKGVTIQFRQ